MAFKKNRKNAKKEFKDAVKGGLGAGIVYLIIFVAFIAVVCLLFFIHVKLNYADYKEFVAINECVLNLNVNRKQLQKDEKTVYCIIYVLNGYVC